MWAREPSSNIWYKCLNHIMCYLLYIQYLHYLHSILVFILPGSLLNVHDDERMKSENWIPLGWLPIIDETRTLRPRKGYQSEPARNTRLFHECWKAFLSNWETFMQHRRIVVYSDGIARMTRHFIAGLLGDQQVKPELHSHGSKVIVLDNLCYIQTKHMFNMHTLNLSYMCYIQKLLIF